MYTAAEICMPLPYLLQKTSLPITTFPINKYDSNILFLLQKFKIIKTKTANSSVHDLVILLTNEHKVCINNYNEHK